MGIRHGRWWVACRKRIGDRLVEHFLSLAVRIAGVDGPVLGISFHASPIIVDSTLTKVLALTEANDSGLVGLDAKDVPSVEEAVSRARVPARVSS